MSVQAIPGTNAEYVVEKQLAVGGMGKVFLGRIQDVYNKNLGISKNQKVILKEPLSSPDDQFQKKLEQEKNLLSILNHPLIPKFIDYFFYNGNYLLVLEYIDGLTLDRYIKKRYKSNNELNETEFHKIANDLFDALIYLHSKKILHRDLKPGNVMFSEKTKHTYLIDFGLAAKKESDEVLFSEGGTELWAPPEQVDQSLRPDQRITTIQSDIFSLGLVFYFCLTGVLPPKKKSIPVDVSKYRKNISPAIIASIKKATEPNPDKRFLNVLHFKTELNGHAYKIPDTPFLVFFNEILPIKKDVVIFGRSKDHSDVVLETIKDAKFISRQHFKIEKIVINGKPYYAITDLDSTNFTRVFHPELKKWVFANRFILQNNDVIGIGRGTPPRLQFVYYEPTGMMKS